MGTCQPLTPSPPPTVKIMRTIFLLTAALASMSLLSCSSHRTAESHNTAAADMEIHASAQGYHESLRQNQIKGSLSLDCAIMKFTADSLITSSGVIYNPSIDITAKGIHADNTVSDSLSLKFDSVTETNISVSEASTNDYFNSSDISAVSGSSWCWLLILIILAALFFVKRLYEMCVSKKINYPK